MPTRDGLPTALTDPAFTMPPVPGGGPPAGLRWLRGTVARFSDGATHARRRLLVTALLARVDPATLRAPAAARTRAVFDDAAGRPVDVAAQVARVVPVDVLAAALRLPPVPAHDVVTVAGAYLPGGDGAEDAAHHAVARLVALFGGVAGEETAARIGLLVQACGATATFVGNAAVRLPGPATRIAAETLLLDPPVRRTRRLDTATGTVVTVDLAAEGLPFGAGPHECPGRAHAVAIAEGILGALPAPSRQGEFSGRTELPSSSTVSR